METQCHGLLVVNKIHSNYDQNYFESGSLITEFL